MRYPSQTKKNPKNQSWNSSVEFPLTTKQTKHSTTEIFLCLQKETFENPIHLHLSCETRFLQLIAADAERYPV